MIHILIYIYIHIYGYIYIYIYTYAHTYIHIMGLQAEGPQMPYSLPYVASSAHMLPHFAVVCHMLQYLATGCPHIYIYIYREREREIYVKGEEERGYEHQQTALAHTSRLGRVAAPPRGPDLVPTSSGSCQALSRGDSFQLPLSVRDCSSTTAMCEASEGRQGTA